MDVNRSPDNFRGTLFSQFYKAVESYSRTVICLQTTVAISALPDPLHGFAYHMSYLSPLQLYL